MNPQTLSMTFPRAINRREACRRALMFSAAMALPSFLQGQETTVAPPLQGLHLFCFGDWGVKADANQKSVADALQRYAKKLGLTPDAMILLGDNFYGPLDGVESSRWKTEFEDMYPADIFPGPCYAILGNHDYDDQKGGEQMQLDYAKKTGTRWKMPDLWYRLDLPQATLLCVNTHYAKLSKETIAQQQAWLEEQLAAPRTAPWMIVCGHHPVMSCGTKHGGTKHLESWQELFYRSKVDAYLAGHEHDLQYLYEEGQPTHWLISGGGGRILSAVDATPQTKYAEARYGFLHLALNAEKMEGVFVGSDAQTVFSMGQKRIS